jgi:hypothetical protein
MAAGHVAGHPCSTLREEDAMYVVTQHTILDRWKAVHATQALTNPPAGIKLHLFLTDTEVSKAVCLWEADSLESIRDMVEEALGPSVNTEFFAVRESAAVGLQELTLGVTPAL